MGDCIVIKKRRITYDSVSLNRAITNGSRADVLQILQQKEVDLTGTDENGNTILHMTCENGKFSDKEVFEILEKFLQCGVDPNCENKHEITVLHLAVVNRMRDVIDLLIRYNVEKDKIDKKGNLVTHFLIRDECKKFWKHQLQLKDTRLEISEKEVMERETSSFIDWLVSRGFDFDGKNNDGQSALQLAIPYNLLHILPSLLNNASDIHYTDKNKKTLLHLFCDRKDSNKRNSLVDSDNVWYSDYIRRYATDCVNILLKRGVSVDACDVHGRTALHSAIAKCDDIELIKFLIARFTNIHRKNQFGRTLFFIAMNKYLSCNVLKADYYLEILCRLRAKGANVNDPDCDHTRPIQLAVSRKSLHAVEFLKESGADFDVTTRTGQNLLHLLADKTNGRILHEHPYEKMFDLLLTSDESQLRAANGWGDSPLHVAAANDNFPIVRKLVEHGVDVDSRNCFSGKTPLLCAIENRRAVEMTKFLLDRGADVNGRDGDFGRGALCRAAAKAGNIEKLKMLLERGARVNARDLAGDTVLHVVVRASHSDATDYVQLLLKYGADINDLGVLRLTLRHGYLSTWTLLVEHWIKLKAVGLTCLKDYEAFFDGKNNYQQRFYQECLVEIEKLRSTLIDSRTSLYHFVRMDPNRRCNYTSNKELLNIVDSPTLKNDFPKYAFVVSVSYHEAVARKPMVEPAVRAWYELTKIDLPEICVDRIVAYLSNEDLLYVESN